QLNIDQIKAKIVDSSLYAPIDGVILEVSIAPGDAVAAYDTVIVIGLPEPKEVIASLAISDANRLSVGMVGKCEVMNRPETAVGCVVRSIPLSSRDADQTTRVAASLEGIAENQLIEVEMALEVRENVLWLPPSVIRTFQNRTFVVLSTADGPRTVDITLGLQTDDRVEITSGVNEGDVVIAP
ncbi:MAG: HlyD family efflux transporter periplasmic adaptor subunit, partial [Chloroflexi bacterium]|nr:HlyD family efflux transporter periplasmic adaptor subunit [Chloroflexota bacterium]